MQTIKTSDELRTADRIQGLLKAILSENSIIPKPFHAVIITQVNKYLNDIDEIELIKQIKKLRDEVIPFLLGEEK